MHFIRMKYIQNTENVIHIRINNMICNHCNDYNKTFFLKIEKTLIIKWYFLSACYIKIK